MNKYNFNSDVSDVQRLFLTELLYMHAKTLIKLNDDQRASIDIALLDGFYITDGIISNILNKARSEHLESYKQWKQKSKDNQNPINLEDDKIKTT